MKAAASVHEGQVFLGSIATVSCNDSRLRQQVEDTEVKVLDLSLPSEIITRQSIKIRLVLSGIPMEDIQFYGAEKAVVAFAPVQFLTDKQIEDEAIQTLCKTMNVTPEDLRVVLQNGFVQALPESLREMDGVKITILPPAYKTLGQVMMTVQLRKNNEVLMTRSAVFDVRRRHRVAVAQVSLSRELPLNESNIQFENRFMPTEVDELQPSQVYGKSIRGSVVAGSIIQLRDLQLSSRSDSDLLIRKGDTVQVIATARRLRTSIRNIEALENGRLGEQIRMRNRDSGKEIVGDVLGPGQAIVRIK